MYKDFAIHISKNAAVLTEDGRVYHYGGIKWHHCANEPAGVRGVTMGPGGVWCYDGAGFVYQYDTIRNAWNKDADASAVVGLSSDADGNLWCVNTRGEFYVRVMNLNDGSLSNWQAHDLPTHKLEKTGERTYVVQPGDNLTTIVRDQYGFTLEDQVAGMVIRIARLNNLADPNSIYVSQVLKLPGVSE